MISIQYSCIKFAKIKIKEKKTLECNVQSIFAEGVKYILTIYLYVRICTLDNDSTQQMRANLYSQSVQILGGTHRNAKHSHYKFWHGFSCEQLVELNEKLWQKNGERDLCQVRQMGQSLRRGETSKLSCVNCRQPLP